MKHFILLFISLLVGCGVAGFQPPKQHFVWYLKDVEKYFALNTTDGMRKYFKKESEDMRACGIDPVIGESDNARANLCLESKGWYLKSGSVCNDPMMYDDPLCVKWRATHKR